ncbi:MAG: sensor histidine kinase [Thermoleophilaceae bacterium]
MGTRTGSNGSLLRRLPLESAQPLLVLALARVVLALLSLLTLLVLSVDFRGEAAGVIAGLVLPWTVAVLALARRRPGLVLNPAVVAGDFGVLAVLELVAPETYPAVQFAALFLIAVHAHLQGERRGLAVAGLGAIALVLAAALSEGGPAGGAVLAFYETVFTLSALATGVLVGRLRTTESASRLRARSLSRRTIQSESEVRRRVAVSIHDGPVQDLIGLDMVLSAARGASEGGDPQRARYLIDEARELTERNVQVLRDEIVQLGPYAFEQMGFAAAIENCLPVWKRRYGFEVMAAIEPIDLPAALAGDLFYIAQEAVANAGRHARAEAVSLSLRRLDGEVELRLTDNGGGFGDVDPLGPAEPGHLGLASMRERAELLEGELEIETSPKGTRVLVRAPLPEGGESA